MLFLSSSGNKNVAHYMALDGLQNYTRPLVLLGEVTINRDLNAKDVYVSGTILGAGLSTDILGTDNTWTGTNDFQNDTFYTGTDPIVDDTDMLTKEDINDAVILYDPLPTDNTWLLAPTFSNANPPILPTLGVLNPSNALIGYVDMVAVGDSTDVDLTKNATNTWTGTNTFTAFVGVDLFSPLENPTLPQNPASKAYIDGKIEVAGKAVTFVVTTPGSYNFANANIGAIGKIDYMLFSGSNSQDSGAVVTGTIGNGISLNGSLQLIIGTTADPAVVYTTQDLTVPSSTQFLVAGITVASAVGACNLNGTLVPGIVGPTTYFTVPGFSADGRQADNLLTYSNLLGTTTSAGGCVFVAYYI